MKAKKVLAVALAAAMAFSALPGMSVKAEEISSGTVYVEQDVIDVTLPTTESQKFYIDPQGLIAIGKGESDIATGQGLVTGKSDMFAVNRSSMPLAFSVSYKLVDSAKSVTIVTDAATAADVKDATGMAIAVSVSVEKSSTDDGTASGAACGGFVYKPDADALASSSGVDLSLESDLTTADVVYASAAGTEGNYVMTGQTYIARLKPAIAAAVASGSATDGYEYDSQSYEYVIDPDTDDASCAKLTIGGYCSKMTDWSDYAKGTKTLKLDVIFKFKKLTKVGDSYYLAAGAAEAEGGSGSSSGLAVSATTKYVTVSVPDGTTVSKVVFVKTDNSTVSMTAGTHYKWNTTNKTFAVLKDALLASPYIGGKFVVTFSNNTVVEISVQ